MSSRRLQQPGARQCTVRSEAEPSLNQSVHTGITSHYTVVSQEERRTSLGRILEDQDLNWNFLLFIVALKEGRNFNV